MIVRVQVPRSRQGKKLMKAKPRRGTGTYALTSMWGRKGQPGLAKLSTNYRERA